MNIFIKTTHNLYSQIISLENLFLAWEEFKKDKRKKKDVRVFERNLEDNLFDLHYRLKAKTYRHSSYTAFNIYDPKFRHIHKAKVIDRIVHHAVVSIIEPIFDKTFIYDSYSCRKDKGTHKAVKRLYCFIRKASKNYTRLCFALQLDIKKFFESVDHKILLEIIKKKIQDKNLLWLIGNILKSFSAEEGIPIGNLTSQLFANIYLDKLDKFIKHKLKLRYYLRYADDFVILSENRDFLIKQIPLLKKFLEANLNLSLHEGKIKIRKHNRGIDFLGYVVLPYYRLLRTRTKRRIFKRMKSKIEDFKNGKTTPFSLNQSLRSYLGFFKHANTYELSQKLKNQIWFWAATMDGSF